MEINVAYDLLLPNTEKNVQFSSWESIWTQKIIKPSNMGKGEGTEQRLIVNKV